MKNKMLGLLLVSIVLLGACAAKTEDAQSSAATEESAAATTESVVENKVDDAAIKKEIQTMREELATVKTAVEEQNAAEILKTAKVMHKHWLDFENQVRQAYPLEYSTVEKYETPIFYGSQYEAPDFEALSENIAGLEESLTKLENAKQTKAKTSEVLNQAVANYQDYLVEQSDLFISETKKFTDAVRAGDIETAKNEYGKARVYYERIEPVAESFGDLDPMIDARINDVDSEADWTGFHVIERALWEDNTTAGMEKFADKLDEDAQKLGEQIQTLKMEPTQMVAGAMELLNEAATTKITGEEEAYSHTDLIDLAANVEGSKVVYQAIIPALNENDSELADNLDSQFNKMEETLANYQSGDSYVAYTELSKDQIREISTELSTLAELMAQTGAIFN